MNSLPWRPSPAPPGPQRRQRSGARRRRRAGGPTTVLIVDSDDDTRAIYSTFLEHNRVRALQTGDVSTALQLAVQNRPDVVVCEIALPRLCGETLVARLRSHPSTAAIPIVVVTSWVFPPDEVLGAAAGCTLMLPKPCSPTELWRAIRAVLR
ncbi:MAG: response regulator [Gemmatimonadetes bacterium]|nr:response regulator [Gemmatimonadota bacterium]